MEILRQWGIESEGVELGMVMIESPSNEARRLKKPISRGADANTLPSIFNQIHNNTLHRFRK
jgi:hypothetical protein